MTLSPSLTCREWEELPVGDGRLTEQDAARLQRAAERAARRLRAPETAVLARTATGLRASQIVGVLVTPGPTLEILPKIDGRDEEVRVALVRMLAVARGLPVATGEVTDLATQRHDLLEIVIRLFTARSLAAARRGLPRHYLEAAADLKLLRGRLDATRQMTHLAVRSDVLACRFDELSENTPLNRVLKAAAAKLAGVTRSAASSRRLAEIRARFEFVADPPDPLRETVRLDRTNRSFHELYRLALLLLKEEWQSTAAGRTRGFALLFAMNDLFEEFVGRSVRRAVAPWRVHLQHRRHHAIDADDRALFALRPDVVVETPNGPLVLDTKWKRLDHREATLAVHQSDLYQMLAYAHAYDASRLVLVYPWHAALGTPGVIRAWRIRGTDRTLEVATIDVGQPSEVVDVLRQTIAMHGDRPEPGLSE